MSKYEEKEISSTKGEYLSQDCDHAETTRNYSMKEQENPAV